MENEIKTKILIEKSQEKHTIKKLYKREEGRESVVRK